MLYRIHAIAVWLCVRPDLLNQSYDRFSRAGVVATLDQFKTLRSSVAPELQQELYGLMASNPDAALSRMVELAAAQGVTTSSDEVRGFLRAMENEEEFDDIVLDAVALTAIAGGSRGHRSCCQEEAHDEPWGRCPGMRPMRKWLFGRSV